MQACLTGKAVLSGHFLSDVGYLLCQHMLNTTLPGNSSQAFSLNSLGLEGPTFPTNHTLRIL